MGRGREKLLTALRDRKERRKGKKNGNLSTALKNGKGEMNTTDRPER